MKYLRAYFVALVGAIKIFGAFFLLFEVLRGNSGFAYYMLHTALIAALAGPIGIVINKIDKGAA